MNKKILVVIAILAVSLMFTPLTFAESWEYPKSNEKFESFDTAFWLDLFGLLFSGEWTWMPSIENPNKLIISYEEEMDFHTITIDETQVYYLDEDFTYSGISVMTIYDPNPLDIFDSRKMTFRVDYMYDFTNLDGLEGTIQMLAIQTGETMHIRSLQGTGDFQNVQIQATLDELGSHTGVVIGWPE